MKFITKGGLTYLLTLVLCVANICASAIERSDSIDILETKVAYDFTTLPDSIMNAQAHVKFKILKGPQSAIRLDLLKMNIDSVVINQVTATHEYNETLLVVHFSAAFQVGAIETVQIYYHGTPVMDASGWGGYYSVKPYKFNLGVGFAANPHSFGRSLFPCFDNFVERSTYIFQVHVNSNEMAVCGGLLDSTVIHANQSRTYYWNLKQEIPSYLASVAIAPYTFLEWDYVGIERTIPVKIASVPSDTARLRLVFALLNQALKKFEDSYGPYQFDRVGYAMVPFNGGAMEHASNIALPKDINNDASGHNLWAHELSHHWWGDNSTCRTPEDMWLNEGWASYSEALFNEIFGTQAYKDYVAQNHFNVLKRTHIVDSGYRALSGVPTQYTYGNTVYKKGADIVHTLRGYMGDTSFFNACKEFQKLYHFKDVSSEDLKNVFQKHCNYSLDLFFKNWIYAPGFPHFEAAITNVTPSAGKYNVAYQVHQGLLGKTQLHDSEMFEITFVGKAYQTATLKNIYFNNTYTYQATLDFEPAFIAFDYLEHKSDAITDQTIYIKPNSTWDGTLALAKIITQGFTDSALMRVEHHWIGGEGAQSISRAYLSPNHYWSVQGIKPSDFQGQMNINYNGTAGNLDEKFIRISEDSLTVLYRKDMNHAWELCSNFQKTMGNVNDKKGIVTIKPIIDGDYALAMYDKKLTIESDEAHSFGVLLYPNPSQGKVYIRFDKATPEKLYIIAYDIQGKKVAKKIVSAYTEHTEIDISGEGIYIIEILDDRSQKLYTNKVMIK